ncbi:MAG TPA: ATP-binding protein [Candidatus Levybacteria bacterium]|nr:ATP-binding protein [Candidatus Levybacteria bacterium]
MGTLNTADLYTILLLVAAANNLALLYLLLRRPDRSSVIVTFAFFLIAITVWGIPQIIINWRGLSADMYVQLDRLSALGYVTIPVIFFLFSLGFVKRFVLLKNFWVSLYLFLPAIVFLYLSWTTFLIDNHSKEAIIINEWGYNSQPGQFFGIFLFWLESLMIASIVVLIQFYRRTTNYIKRRQVILLIIAILIPLIFGTITDGILPVIEIHIFPAAVPLTTVMAMIIGFAIMRYELFDFEAQTILSSIGDGLITVNASGRVMNMNETAQKMVNKEVRTVLNKKITSILKSYDKNDTQKLESAIDTGKQLLSSDYILKARHRSLPVAITVTPVIIEDRVEGATILVKDIREEKKKEESKDDFISIASHELKTPITSIKLYADILGKKISPKSSEYPLVSKLQGQVDRMVELTNDLLDLSRIRTGSMHLQLEWFDISTFVKDIVTIIGKTEPERNIIIKGNVTKKIYADKNRIGQVVTNLVTNAIKYSPKSTKVVISIQAKKSHVQISVKDYGQGIPVSQQSKIFNRFYRVTGATTDQPSLGIGLYITATIIKQHKGKIWVESSSSRKNKSTKKSHGSTFIFTLPFALAQKETQ